ncbi:MAG: SDR family oxidoreductase [Actinomycetia bacterium]|nr:SDR family oxidoreductase [Actinomycetes bacterium]
MVRFEGRNAIITGSTQGLGATLARRMVDEGLSGLVVTGRNAERGEAVAAELAAGGCDAVFVAADMADAASVEALIDRSRERFGVVHHLANCAALTTRGDVWDTTPEYFDEMMAVNLRSPFQLVQGVARMLRDAGSPGTIVNVGSIAWHGGQPFITPYVMTKSGLVTMTKTVAYQLMRYGIRINIVNPGWMDTDGEDLIQRRFHGATDGWLERAEADRPFGRLVKPEELVTTLAFVLSEDSGMMTGAVIDYDQSVPGAGDAPVPPVELGPDPT